MAIERVSAKEGLVVPKGIGMSQLGLVALAALETGEAIHESLVEGTYDLTPSVWRRNLHVHLLDVHADGTGVYRTIPKDENVGVYDINQKSYRHGAQYVRLPEDQGGVMVGGFKQGTTEIHMFEFILHLP